MTLSEPLKMWQGLVKASWMIQDLECLLNASCNPNIQDLGEAGMQDSSHSEYPW